MTELKTLSRLYRFDSEEAFEDALTKAQAAQLAQRARMMEEYQAFVDQMEQEITQLCGEPIMSPGHKGPGVMAVQHFLNSRSLAEPIMITGIYDEATQNVMTLYQKNLWWDPVDGRLDKVTYVSLITCGFREFLTHMPEYQQQWDSLASHG